MSAATVAVFMLLLVTGSSITVWFDCYRCYSPCCCSFAGSNSTSGFDWAVVVPLGMAMLFLPLHALYLLKWVRRRFRIAPARSFFLHGIFHSAWLAAELSEFQHVTPVDVQRTLLEFTARSISSAVDAVSNADRVLLCGGGSHNHLLHQRLQALLPDVNVGTTTQFGIDADWLEAMAFAWLAQQRLEARTGNAPTATGAHQPCVLGGIYLPT